MFNLEHDAQKKIELLQSDISSKLKCETSSFYAPLNSKHDLKLINNHHFNQFLHFIRSPETHPAFPPFKGKIC